VCVMLGVLVERLAPILAESYETPKRHEQRPERTAETQWARHLQPATAPTVARCLPTQAARERYGNGDKLVLMDGLLTVAECNALSEAAETIGFGKTAYPQDYRGNLRLIVTDPGLSSALWQRVRPLVPETVDVVDPSGGHAAWRAVGLNECIRLAKYYPGSRFGAHCDACFQRDQNECSLYTLNVYTNTVPPEHGGATRFYSKTVGGHKQWEADLLVQPEAGLAICFRQPPGAELLHDGEELRGGVKYLLRSDVIYRRVLSGDTEETP